MKIRTVLIAQNALLTLIALFITWLIVSVQFANLNQTILEGIAARGDANAMVAEAEIRFDLASKDAEGARQALARLMEQQADVPFAQVLTKDFNVFAQLRQGDAISQAREYAASKTTGAGHFESGDMVISIVRVMIEDSMEGYVAVAHSTLFLRAIKNRLVFLSVFLLSFTALGVGGLSWFFGTRLARPIQTVAEAARAAAKGNLNVGKLSSGRRDEIGVLTTAFDEMLGNLREILTKIQSGISLLMTSSAQISTTSKQAVSTAAEQASTVNEIASTVEEIKTTSAATAGSAQEVQGAADRATASGQRGQEAIRLVSGSTNALASAISAVATKVQALSRKNEQVGDIVESVNDLAEQSNLLAVNASIEAAKAGELGRGFAVVAAEVRSLAEQSKQAARQIRTILAEIQVAINEVVSATGDAGRNMSDGRAAIGTMEDSLVALAGVLEENADKARHIAGAVSQQTAGIHQIAEAIQAVDAGSRDTEAGARQLEGAVSSLLELSRNLEQILAKYNL